MGFVGRVNVGLSGFTWLTLVNGYQTILSQLQIAADDSVWASGITKLANFPITSGAFLTQAPSGASGFLIHLSADGTQELAGTYLPASFSSMVLDGSGDVVFTSPYVAGLNATPGSQWPCRQQGTSSGFIGKLDSAAKQLIWGTATGPAIPIGPVTVDTSGNAVVAGNIAAGAVALASLTTISGPPRLVDTCVQQAGVPGTFGPLVAGEVLSIYGAGLGPASGVAAPTSVNAMPTTLGGVQVFIENMPVPLLYASSVQINAVAPFLLNGRTAAHVKVVTEAASSNEVVLGVRQAAPEIFTTSNGIAILNHDWTLNSPDNPTAPGEGVSMWVSGLGQTSPGGTDGAIASTAGAPPLLPITVQVTAGNVMIEMPSIDATISYIGNAPGLVAGIEQINFQVPANLSTQGFQGGMIFGQPLWAGVTLIVGGQQATTTLWYQ